jgi:hypothetical protein
MKGWKVSVLKKMETTSTSSNQSLYGDPDSCSVNRIRAAAVMTSNVNEVEIPPARHPG